MKISEWPIEKCRQFMKDWTENEQHMGKQTALAVTCEEYGISYVDIEWMEVVERVADAQITDMESTLSSAAARR